MKTKQFIFALATGFAFAVNAATGFPSLRPLAEQAISADPAISSSAVAKLRAEGPAGLDALLSTHAALLQQHEKNALVQPPREQSAWQRLQHAIDAVSAQRDCSASHLYWYTNFDDAKAAAKASGKPILSLRLLGNLDEEYSCANSRFFRTTLYANAEVSQYLRDHFILHWKSVRPVPRITIDFGDGRKIERTITGNSIHYILDPDGHPIDALPGLYGPKAFLNGLADAEAIATVKLIPIMAAAAPADLNEIQGCGGRPFRITENNPPQTLRRYHLERLAAIQSAWRNDMLALGQFGTARKDALTAISGTLSPTGLAAATRAESKSAVELPMLKSFQAADDDTWSRVATLHTDEAVLDAASTALIRAKYPSATEAGRVAFSKSVVESPLNAMFRNLQRSIAEDTVRNEYLLHSQIHEWFINGTAPQDIDQLNAQVYAKLFLTPDSDPWLGLVPANTFTGLDNNGLVQFPR